MVAPTPTAPQQPHTAVRFVFAALMTTMLMSSLAQMIFTTALPTIVGELGGVNHMSWVISAFFTAMTCAMPISGKLGDAMGRKWLYIGSIGLFLVGSALGGFSSSMGMLIVARTIQGFAAGSMMVNSQAILAEVVPARQRGKFMGFMGAVFGFSSVVGPILGGWFTDGPGWRWAMWMNIPLGITAMMVATVVLKLRTGHANWRHFDFVGTVLMVVSTTSLILLTTWGGTEYAWTSPLILGLSAIVIVGAALFILTELKAQDPLIPLWLMKNRNMALTVAASIVLGATMMGALAYLPTYLQMVHTLTPTEAGLMMTPLMAGMIITSTLVGFLMAHTGNYKIYPIIGLIISAVALSLMSLLTPETTLVVIGGMLMLFGVGLGMVMQVLVLIVQNSFPVAVVGTATATNNFFRTIGSATGTAIVGSLFAARLADNIRHCFPEGLGGMDPNSLTPAAVAKLDGHVLSTVVTAYNDALTPIFILMAPLALISAALLTPIRRDALKETIE